MADRTIVVDMTQLEERVRAAAWMIPEKETRWRRLATRSRGEFDPKSGWMIPLDGGTEDRFAVELVPCDADEPGAVSMQKNELPEQIRLDAQVLYDLWEEESVG